MNNTSKTISKGFKATYLRLLTGEPPAEADYWAARDLIDNGHANGHYQVSQMALETPAVTDVIGFTPTMSGRLFADELAEQARKSSTRYRLMQAALGAITFGAGWIAGVASQVVANWATKMLGG